MITEGIVAMIWAAAAIKFAGSYENLMNLMMVEGKSNPAVIVNAICQNWMGAVGAVLAILGVVAAPITSGDTAFRSARLIVADVLHIEQRSILKRLMVSLPLFVIGTVLLFVDFDIIWRYFAWTNQAMSVVTLWMIVVYLRERGRNIWVALPPAIFMTLICSTFVFVSDQFVGLGATTLAYMLGAVTTLILSALLWMKVKQSKKLIK
jgi:carbon starvation protein CstA